MSDIFEKIILLKKSNVFSEVKTDDLRYLALALEDEMYAKGDRVFDINDRGDRMYIIQSGKVGISTNENPNVKDYVISLGPGNTFGELNLLDDLPRSATAHILENSHILSLEKERLHHLILNYPEISLGVLKSISLRLRHTTTKLQELSEKK